MKNQKKKRLQISITRSKLGFLLEINAFTLETNYYTIFQPIIINQKRPYCLKRGTKSNKNII